MREIISWINFQLIKVRTSQSSYLNENICFFSVQKLRDWKACHFDKLPDWMRDNEYLHFGHRPQLPEFAECFRSIFRIHSETGNIWTHLIGFVAFVIATIVFYVKPFCDNCHHDIQVKTHKYKYFAGIIIVNSRYVSM